MQIILGSKSPRRKEILEFFSLPFQTIHASFDEESIPYHGDPEKFVIEVAKGKALELNQLYPNKVVLTADTMVSLNGKIYGKPSDLQEAKKMLLELSGKEHEVFTGVVVAKGKDFFFDSARTLVEFHKLTESQIETYHKQIYPLDKAGAYAIQKAGSLIVKRIEGCYYNVIGLPLGVLDRLLKKVGIDLWDFLKST